jgi:ribosomal protein S14
MNEKQQKQTLLEHHKAFVELQNHCPLCQSQLKISVQFEVSTQSIREEANCEKCDLLTRVKNHRVH